MLEEIQGHIDGHPDQSDSDWDDILTGNISEKDQKNSRITGDLENIMLLHPDSNLSKAKLLAYINKLDAESQNIAVQWIKNKIENFILNLKNHMQSGIVMDGDEYFSFLSDLQINVTLKYPLNEELQKYLAESLLKMYLELRTNKKTDTDIENLNILSTWIELFISGLVNSLEIPQSLITQLNKLGINEINAKPLSGSGAGGIAPYVVFPIPDLETFPDIEPFKSTALDLLEGMKEKAYSILKKAGSMDNYFYLKAETSVPKDLNGRYAKIWTWKSSEMELFALLNIEKRKLDDLLVDVEKIIETLKRLLIAKNENGKKDSEKSLIEYKEKLELHINSIWEKAILPHLMFYTHLILGKCKKNSLGWL